MAAPQQQTVVIICPHCTTRYQVPSDTVGPKGRQVQCAHCGKAWQAFAEKTVAVAPPPPAPKPAMTRPAADDEPDQMFDAAAEAQLDAEFEAEEQAEADAVAELPEAGKTLADIKAAIAPKSAEPKPEPPPPPSSAGEKQRRKALDERQSKLSRQLPLARVRRGLRIGGLVTLTLLLGSAFTFRTEIVKLFPDLAGTYEALGLDVNVVGLEFRDVKTLLSLRRGADVMQVDARIYSVAPGKVAVPPVVVTLLAEDGHSLYEWSVMPDQPVMSPGEVMDFSSQVTDPPEGTARVRLTFADRRLAAPLPEPVADAPAPEAQPVHEEQAH